MQVTENATTKDRSLFTQSLVANSRIQVTEHATRSQNFHELISHFYHMLFCNLYIQIFNLTSNFLLLMKIQVANGFIKSW